MRHLFMNTYSFQNITESTLYEDKHHRHICIVHVCVDARMWGGGLDQLLFPISVLFNQNSARFVCVHVIFHTLYVQLPL